jgi:hypothetical protein
MSSTKEERRPKPTPRLIMNVLPLPILSVTVSPGRHWFPPWNRRSPALRGRGFSMSQMFPRISSKKSLGTPFPTAG